MLSWLMPLRLATSPTTYCGIADPGSCFGRAVGRRYDGLVQSHARRAARHFIDDARGCSDFGHKYQGDHTPIDPQMESIPYTRAYLHHLFKQNEPLALTLASLHNIYYKHEPSDAGAAGRILRDEI